MTSACLRWRFATCCNILPAGIGMWPGMQFSGECPLLPRSKWHHPATMLICCSMCWTENCSLLQVTAWKICIWLTCAVYQVLVWVDFGGMWWWKRSSSVKGKTHSNYDMSWHSGFLCQLNNATSVGDLVESRCLHPVILCEDHLVFRVKPTQLLLVLPCSGGHGWACHGLEWRKWWWMLFPHLQGFKGKVW